MELSFLINNLHITYTKNLKFRNNILYNKIKNLYKSIAQVKGFYVHLRKGINEHMWGFIKTVNKLLTVVWATLVN